MRGWWAAALLLGAAAGAAGQDVDPNLAEVVGPDGRRIPQAQVVLLPAALPKERALAAFIGTDLVRAARDGQVVMAVGEMVGRIGFVALDLSPDASVHPAPAGVADLLRAPAGEYWAVAGAPGHVPATAVRWTKTDTTPGLRLAVIPARSALVTFDLDVRWAKGTARASRVTLRALPMRPERARRIVYRQGDHRIDLQRAGRLAGDRDAATSEQIEAHGAVRARCTRDDLTLLLPCGKTPLALAVSPEVELRVWGGRRVRAGRLGVLRLGDETKRSLLLRPHRSGNARVTVRVVDAKKRVIEHAVVYLFPEGGTGFDRRGLGNALDRPKDCVQALRDGRLRPPRNDLTVAGARKVTTGGTAKFEGLAPGAMRCVVVADGYAQRFAPEIEVPEDGETRSVTVPLHDLRTSVGVVRVAVQDPITGPFQGRLHWSVSMPGFNDNGRTTCREDGITLYVPPGTGISVHCSTGERGGLAGSVQGVTAALGTATQTRLRLMPPKTDGKRR